MPVSEQGIFTNRYTLIPRVLIFVTREESVLLIKGAPDKRVWPNLYNGIGGHIEPGESVLEGAKREFLEETGLPLLSPWLTGIITIDTGQIPGIGMYVFSGEVGAGKLVPSEEGQLKWVSIEKLTDIPLVEDLPVLLPEVLEIPQGGIPLFAHYSYDEEQKLQIRLT
ncbi:MAG: NUDIX domain-containing protein [Chloroflexota bacterium]